MPSIKTQITTKLSKDEIKNGYELILNRQPESEKIYEIHSKHDNYNSFLSSLLNSEEFLNKNQRWKAFYSHNFHRELIKKYAEPIVRPSSGSIVNFIGVKTDLRYVPWAIEGAEGLPIPGNFHATEAEWIAVLRAVDLAKKSFTIIELGAGWGCWIVNATILAKRRGFKVKAIGIDGDPQHINFMHTHCAANGLEPSEYSIQHAIISHRKGGAAFPLLNDNYGQEPAFFDTAAELQSFMEENKNSYIQINTISLAELLDSEPRCDLLHIDIQGGEVEVIKNSVSILNSKVAYLFVGTHGRDIEGQIMTLMLQEGWLLDVEEPCNHPLPLKAGATYIDGAQGWLNPRLQTN